MWMDMGLVSAGGMGPTRLSALEITAWQQGTQRVVLPWEFSTIREMSMSYLTMLREGEKPETPAPYGEVTFDREVVGKKVANLFKALVMAKNQ